MKRRKSIFGPLADLEAKPSDYRPGRYEQLTIDDELRKVETNHQETLIIKCNLHIPPYELQQLQEQLVKQRKEGIVMIPNGFELLCILPPEVKLMLENGIVNDAEKFIDDFWKENTIKKLNPRDG